jgi:hypothetical protein
MKVNIFEILATLSSPKAQMNMTMLTMLARNLRKFLSTEIRTTRFTGYLNLRLQIIEVCVAIKIWFMSTKYDRTYRLPHKSPYKTFARIRINKKGWVWVRVLTL